MSNKDKKDLVVFADLEVKLKEFMTELDSLDDDTDYRDLNQFFKVLAFKLS